MTNNEEKRKRGRPRNNNKVHSIRCSPEEFLEIKEFLRKLRLAKKSASAAAAELEAKGQQKLKF